ncbi:MAG: helix-turn-helix domain-containing protein [Chloroflexi bacterium]|nr:helix-turn-helix domain-containing protein [Chloroflexota bacterium]
MSSSLSIRNHARSHGPNDKGAKHNKPRNKKSQIKNEENPVMRADEVRQILGIGKNTIYTWANEGKIPCKRVGRIIIFSRKRFNEWLENMDNLQGA